MSVPVDALTEIVIDRPCGEVAAYGHRTGDVILVSRLSPRWPRDERTYFARAHNSFHGSASTLDAIVPLVVARARSDGAALRAMLERVLLHDRSHTRTTALVLELLHPQESSTALATLR